jgi:thioredoxin 1
MKTAKITEDSEFFKRIETGVSLFDFNAPWCAPCRVQAPIIRQLADKFEGKASITALNIDENRETALRLDIHSIPTLIIFKDGREIQRFIGLQSEDVLSRALENVLG